MVPQMCLLAHFEATLDFSRSEFTCTYINLWLCYYGQVKFSTAKIECTINSKINGTTKCVHFLISKVHSILAVANLLAHNSLWLYVTMGK